ncbi:hypothetical protein [Peptostreptococcus canis]|uniref:Uncharacterized protein n=1 Tax=Peptostreptococcus canis TaxID=1159213 RepID=A0ABR6TM11_9FIRM|nr:hypothetical protein [Peptostreptococcus canis]MBC2576457.1 hypothetical protein [Peptostreptococcus canis]MBP1998432.1 hypothetical protein [Peptostreptococcus canis]
MNRYYKLTEEILDNLVDNLINDNSITTIERNILLEYKSKKNDSFMKRISDFKTNVSKFQLEYGFDALSNDMLSLYTEICRQYPTTGPSSIFNILIKK